MSKMQSKRAIVVLWAHDTIRSANGKQIHVFQEEISSNIVFKHFNDRNRGNSNSIC